MACLIVKPLLRIERRGRQQFDDRVAGVVAVVNLRRFVSSVRKLRGGDPSGPNGTGAQGATAGTSSGGTTGGPASGGTTGVTSGSSGTGTGGGSSGSSSGGSSGSSGTGSDVPVVCDDPSAVRLGSEPMRRLSSTEYLNTLHDLFPTLSPALPDLPSALAASARTLAARSFR